MANAPRETSFESLTIAGMRDVKTDKLKSEAQRLVESVSLAAREAAAWAQSYQTRRTDRRAGEEAGRIQQSWDEMQEKVATLSAPQIDWRTILDALPGAAIALDFAGNVCHFNAPAAAFYPKLRAEQPISHVSRNPELMGAVEKIATSKETISVELVERIPVERRFFATLRQIGPGIEIAGQPHALITFHDTSEQDKLVQMRADFIANASHELRTPLASLRGFIETLQGPARDDAKARERFLGLMMIQATRMTRLIDDLLSLSRAEMRAHLPPQGLVELNETCASVLQSFEDMAETAHAKLTFSGLPERALIRGERDEIVQVLQNLIQNAIKYGRDGGTVAVTLARIATTAAGSSLQIAVADDGPGISAEHLPRLTERFYRANVSASREKGGTGLGLAIVKHIVNRHRGDLKILSTPGKGSVFTVTFDAVSAPQHAAAANVKK